MEKLKNVLIFISTDMKEFLINIFINLAYFALILIITIFIFYKTIGSDTGTYTYFFYLFILLIIDFSVRRKFFVKFQLKQNFNYIKFISKYKNGSQEIPSLNEWKKISNGVRITLKNADFSFLTLNTLISLTTLTAYKKDKTIFQKEFIKNINSFSIKLLMTGYLLFILILSPFFLISFFFTIGMDIQIRILIYLIAFIFASFIKVSVLNPLLSLLLQEETLKIK